MSARSSRPRPAARARSASAASSPSRGSSRSSSARRSGELLGLVGGATGGVGAGLRRVSRAARQRLQASAQAASLRGRGRRRRRAAAGGCAASSRPTVSCWPCTSSSSAPSSRSTADAGRLVVDEGARAAVGAQRAAQHQVLVRRVVQALLLQHGPDGDGRAPGAKMAVADAWLGAAAHQAGVGARAGGEAERVEDDRLAGAGLAGERGQARPERQVEASRSGRRRGRRGRSACAARIAEKARRLNGRSAPWTRPACCFFGARRHRGVRRPGRPAAAVGRSGDRCAGRRRRRRSGSRGRRLLAARRRAAAGSCSCRGGRRIGKCGAAAAARVRRDRRLVALAGQQRVGGLVPGVARDSCSRAPRRSAWPRSTRPTVR